jgi:hypothetical protein
MSLFKPSDYCERGRRLRRVLMPLRVLRRNRINASSRYLPVDALHTS